MSRFTGPRGKIVRRFGMNIYENPKFDRLLAKRPNAPGIHGVKKSRKKVSDYGLQLTEKQKLKYTYGLRERQFRVFFAKAQRKKGITGDNLLILLESRLDNVIFRMGMAPTRDAARQLICHGHIKINDRRVNVASFILRENDEITGKNSAKSRALIQRYFEDSSKDKVPEWVAVDKEQLKGQMLRSPIRSDIQSVANEQLVVELYSK